jgi:putative colanic acid biosynthesis acetyltransferase WcaF
MKTTDLSSFSNPEYHHGKSLPVRFVWLLISRIFFQTVLPYPNAFKAMLLCLFGAKVGKKVVIKPNVNIKQPWRLSIGAYSWIGEGVWIDNLVQVTIGTHCCLSQGSFLLTGNHNYKKSSFDLITGSITLEEGVWIGAKSIVGPNVICQSHSVLSAGSCAFKNLEAYSIYQGNPAKFLRNREL